MEDMDQTPTPGYLNSVSPQEKARSLVYGWAKGKRRIKCDFEDVKVVWFCKTLENWKAIVAIIGTPDQLLFEVTYSGVNKDTYVDAYQKVDKVVVKDEDL